MDSKNPAVAKMSCDKLLLPTNTRFHPALLERGSERASVFACDGAPTLLVSGLLPSAELQVRVFASQPPRAFPGLPSPVSECEGADSLSL